VQVTFLGTSAGVPTRACNVAGIALRLPQRAEWWLFDCGEATQHQLLKSDLSISQLTRIFITHLHGDHLFGLPGLLATKKLSGSGAPIHIYGPVGLEQFMRACWQLTRSPAAFDVFIHTIENGEVYVDDEFKVSCRMVQHRVPAFGYRVAEKERAGRFRVAEALALGIPEGPLFAQLKRGETITLVDGRRFDGATLCEPPQAGRSLAYSGDTTFCDDMIELAKDADMLIHEATFADAELELARRSYHSTALMAAQVAAQAHAKQLILTHISPRYFADKEIQPDDLLREARAVFPRTELAHDFSRFEIERRD
jgi:ribonuclease Z